MRSRAELQRWATKQIRVWIELFGKHDLLTYASAIAFQVLKSLVPLTLLGIGLLGVLGRRDVWTSHLAPAVKQRVTPSLFHAIDVAVRKIFAHDGAPLVVFAAF